jgi:dynein heavy chain
LLQGLIPSREEKDAGALTREHYERLYIFALMWSVGAFLELDDRAKLEEFVRKNQSIKLDLPKIQSEAEGSMFDYYVDEKGSQQYVHN